MGLRLLAVACLVGAAFAGPFQRQPQCATRCLTSDNEKFHYEPGKKYVYDYEGLSNLLVAGLPKQTTKMFGQIELHVKSKCDMVFKMRNIRIEEKATQEETDELRRKLEIPLPFQFEDGKIEHVCSSSEESKQSLNFKKAILSTFINTMSRLDQSQEVSEVDSLGTCVTKYTVRNFRQTVIEKEKDLKSCTNRHSSLTSLITNPYESPESAIHSAPIFPTDKLTCKQTVEDGVIKSSKCKEHSSIKPLGQSKGIIEFEGQVQLMLKTVESAENFRLESKSSQEAIVFNLQEESSLEDVEREVEELLRRKCSESSALDLSASKDFIFLVSAVKRLSYESLQRLYSSLESGSICSSKRVTDMFLDTLPMAGSDGAIELMVNLIVQQRVTGLKAKLWSASLALISHPSHDAIKAVARLVKEQRSGSVLLGVSAMVYRHCLHHRCSNSQSVKDIVTTLNQVLGQQCSYENEDEAVAVLKAFGNMGQILHSERNILACVKDSEKPIRVRLAAIDAFRRTDKARPDDLLQLYASTEEDYEVRIAALYSVMRRADKRQISLIKTVAEQERNEQVSAYTATLISNLNKTSSPLKQSVRQRLSEFEIETPKSSYWENSKNIELTTFSKVLNVGGGVETDIIHSSDTKLPRSVRTRFDLEVFGNHLNVFELGLRAEGLEAAFEKLIGFQQRKERKSSPWSLMRSRSEDADDKVEAQFFFRTMDMEIADFSVSDLTSMGEMVKVADILNKLSHEKSADFSHSFMFVNSKLVIPSVTGRSYSFGLTGSATVGLTAKSKVDIVDILSRSKNCDIHGHFQPSVNVELAATVGIHSEKPRPDVKIVTRMHSESHIEAQFRIKDSHLALVKVSVPSENIAYTRISSDIIEIDEHHQEKPVYDEMQKKIDYCFDKLDKPLGLSVCGKWEVPRPFMSKTFPFVKGVGNMELSIRKTDLGMKSYEMSVEIPKRRSSVMTYKVLLDTPGSRINRRFSADLEVRMPSREQKRFSLQLRSPFELGNALANGSLTSRQDLIDGSFEIQAGSSKRYSIKASSPISETDSQRTYSPSIEISDSSSQPLKIEGSLSISKGRKQEISFDMKCNKPSRKPLSLKGTIMKDGNLSVSKSSEWKLSSDVALRSPIVNLNVRSSTEKQSRQSDKVSTTLSVDYQRGRSKRESVKFSANFQRSSSKISSVAQFETSQYPSANLILTWNKQGRSGESIKNDITLKYGNDPEHHYINILQSGRMHESQTGECRVAVKAPQFDIDSDLTVSHDFQRNSRLHTDLDLRYREDKHMRAKFHVDKLSERPLKLKMKVEINTPYRRMLYQDELEEISDKSYKGMAAFEWRAGRRTELQYKYQMLSDESKLHHEIETSLRLPSSRSPIKNKASIEIRQEMVGIEGRVSLDRRSEYSIKAELNKRGSSYVNLKVPKLEGNLKLVNSDDKKAADLDLKSSLFRSSRHVTASASVGLGSQKKFETEICFDADRQPEKKFMFSSSFENQPRNKYACSTRLQISDKVNFEVVASGDRAIYGRHETSVQASLLKFQSVGFLLHDDLRPKMTSVMVRFSRNQRPKVEASFSGERSMNRGETELSTSAILKSLDNSFQTKEWSYNCTFSRSSSGSSVALKSNARLEWSPSKVYECEAAFDFQPNVITTKAYMNTPHFNYRRQSISFSYRNVDQTVVSSASVEFSNGKSMSITSETQRIYGGGLTSSLIITSPFEAIKDARVSVSYDNKRSQKSLKSFVDVNGSRKADVELSFTSARMTEIKGHVKTSFAPEVSGYIRCENDKDSFKYELQIMKGSSNLMAASLLKQSSNQDVTYALQSKSQEKTLVDLKMVKETTSVSTKHKLQAQGVIPEISFIIESSRKDKNSLNLGIEACLTKRVKSCYSVKGYHKTLMNEENYRFYRKLTVDVEKSSENSSPRSLGSINIVGSISGNDYREKFTVEMQDKKVGYEIRLHRRENEQDHCSLDSHIFTPYSTIRVLGSITHNNKSILSEFEIVPDSSVPTRKLGFELKKEKEGNEITGYLKLYHPEIRHPMQVSGRIQHEGLVPISGKLRWNYSLRDKDYILEIVPEQESRRQGKRVVTYKLYRDDKSFEASAKLMKYVTSHESEYSYDWAYLNKHEQKQGKFSLKLSEKVNGRPRAFEMEFNTPSTSTKLRSRLTWESRIPSGLTFNFLSNNENIFELDLKAEDDCLYVNENLRSRPFMNHELCFLKKEGSKMRLISVHCQYQRRPSFEFEIEVDPDHHNFANLNVNWVERSIRLAKRDVKQLFSEMSSRYVSPEDWEIITTTGRFYMSLANELVHDGMKKMRESFNQQCYTMELYFRKASHALSSACNYLSEYFPIDYLRQEIFDPLVKTVKCLTEKYVETFNRYIDETCHAFWEVIIKKITESLKVYCPEDSFCYEFADAVEKMEPETMKMLVSNKYRNMKRSVSECFERLHFPDIRELVERFVESARRELHVIFSALTEGKLPQLFTQYIRRLESFASEKIKEEYKIIEDWILSIFHHLEGDEDFRVLRALVIEWKDKLWLLIKKGETFVESVCEPLYENLKEYPRKWMQERMTIQKFSPKEGNIQVQIRHPLNSKHIQVLRNIYISMKNKCIS